MLHGHVVIIGSISFRNRNNSGLPFCMSVLTVGNHYMLFIPHFNNTHAGNEEVMYQNDFKPKIHSRKEFE